MKAGKRFLHKAAAALLVLTLCIGMLVGTALAAESYGETL